MTKETESEMEGDEVFSCGSFDDEDDERTGNTNENSTMDQDMADRNFMCSICNRRFRQKQTLKQHILTHTGQRPYSCEICSKTFTQAGALQRHMASLHDNTLFPCHLCPKKFNQRNNFKRHLKLHTGEGPTYDCKICYRSFKRKDGYDRHAKQHMSVLEMHFCKYCDRSFATQNSLLRHERIHHKVGLFKSSVVNKEMLLQNASKSKRKTKNRNTLLVPHRAEEAYFADYECQFCIATFQSKRRLNKHYLVHREDVSDLSDYVRIYQCHFCGLLLTGRSCIISHLKKHEKRPSAANNAREICKLEDDQISLDMRTTEDQYLSDMESENVQRNQVVKEEIITDDDENQAEDACDSNFVVKLQKIEGMEELISYAIQNDDESTRSCGQNFDDEDSNIGGSFSGKQLERPGSVLGDNPISVVFEHDKPVKIIYTDNQYIQIVQCETPDLNGNKVNPTTEEKLFLKYVKGDSDAPESPTVIEFPTVKQEEDEFSDQETIALSEVEEKDARFLDEMDERTTSAPSSPARDVDIEKELADAEMNMNIQPQVKTHQSAQVKVVTAKYRSPDATETHGAGRLYERADNDEVKMFFEDKFVIYVENEVNDSPYSCYVCKRTYKSKSSLERHFKVKHTNKSKVKCPKCPKATFQSNDAYLKHKRALHENARFSCEECGRKFNHKFSLECHARLHTGERPFACDRCDLRFPTKQNLYAHSKKHLSEKPFRCEVCNKGFHAKSVLNKHMLIHNNVKNFKCHLCNRSFIQKNHLTKHQICHGFVDQLFPCNVCHKEFPRKAALFRHLETHEASPKQSKRKNKKEIRKEREFILPE